MAGALLLPLPGLAWQRMREPGDRLASRGLYMSWDEEHAAAANVPGQLVIASVEGSASGYAYTPELGAQIAELYAENMGDGLWGLHYFAPAFIPRPTTIRAWERQHPAFGLLMKQAEKLRAEKMMEETVTIADNIGEHPARSALRIGARQRFAAKLDSSRFGDARSADAAPLPLGKDEQPTAPALSDDELMRLAQSIADAQKS